MNEPEWMDTTVSLLKKLQPFLIAQLVSNQNVDTLDRLIIACSTAMLYAVAKNTHSYVSTLEEIINLATNISALHTNEDWTRLLVLIVSQTSK
jgi:hypothetical protein